MEARVVIRTVLINPPGGIRALSTFKVELEIVLLASRTGVACLDKFEIECRFGQASDVQRVGYFFESSF